MEEKEKENLSKQQKKNRKKKEAAKRKKEQAKELVVNEHQNELAAKDAKTEKSQVVDDVVDNFEDELCWCIQQIEIGMRTQKPIGDQATKSKKLLTQLRSTKTPKPKKRMLMKNNFGDYRRKMTEQLKKANIVTPKIVDVDEDVVKKSVFVKKKANDLPPTSGSDNNNTGFMFNFPDPN